MTSQSSRHPLITGIAGKGQPIIRVPFGAKLFESTAVENLTPARGRQDGNPMQALPGMRLCRH